ncbi:lipocalin family protein [Caulobacter segnis]|uniref:lipocalin family protein n=1 Tax=Caulobacter segnis TaxID=88688 RepID=UPI00240FD4CA|nr:lipocalin family protein [Caulobacter segnis]MDG2523475.1 lipocalin family protein [Caulobacter segnis]
MRTLAAMMVAFALPAAAFAAAPEPRKPIEIDRFMGRWYEIVRTPNDGQKNCHSASQLWSQRPDGTFDIAQTCRKGSPSGPLRLVETRARILDPGTNAKFEASFFGGLLRRKYWVIDRSDDYGWMIASTADGDFVALLSRQPTMPDGQVQALIARMRSLGFVKNQLLIVAR